MIQTYEAFILLHNSHSIIINFRNVNIDERTSNAENYPMQFLFYKFTPSKRSSVRGKGKSSPAQ